MEDRDALVQKTVKRLQAIRSLDDFKGARQEIFDLMERLILSAIDQLKAFFEQMFSMSPDEKQEGAAKFQDDGYLLSPDIMKELDRLTDLPGARAYAEEFSSAMEKHIGPKLEEAAAQMGKLMENLMGGIAQGMADAMGANAAEEEEQLEAPFAFDYDDPDTPLMLYPLYMSRTLSELEEQKEGIIETAVDKLQEDIWKLETLADPAFAAAREDDKEEIAEIRHRAGRIAPEVEKEFARLAALPGAEKAAGKIKKELLGQIAPKMKELKANLAKLK